MYKISLNIVALIFATTAFAQNNSDVDQVGNANNANVDQTGQNNSIVTQEFTANQAIVNQLGRNFSDIQQSGNVGGSSSSGESNLAEVNQSGGGFLGYAPQSSTIIQEGDDNIAKVDQAGLDNESKIQQGNNGNAENNFANVIQVGMMQKSDVLQTYDNNYTTISQFGGVNTIKVEQVALPNQTEGNYSSLYQNGFGNSIESVQVTAGGVANQNFSNREYVTQLNNYNTSVLLQNGDNNISVVGQSGGFFPGSDGDANYAEVAQLDNLNASSITQERLGLINADNSAVVNQSGNLQNQTVIMQKGANAANVIQSN